MKIVKFGSWWVRRDQCLFGEKRRGGGKMPWGVVVIKLTTDTGIEGIATAMAARSGQVTESYLCDTVAPMVVGCSSYDREKIFYDFWSLDCHEVFFLTFLPGSVDIALWDICVKATGLPLYQYIGAYRESLPVYAGSLSYDIVDAYVNEALYYHDKGIPLYKAHPPGLYEFDMKIHQKLREAVGPDMGLMTGPVGEYSLDEVITMGRHLEKLNYLWFEELFRDFELCKYQELYKTLDIPVAVTETTRGVHWGVAQVISQRAADVVRADASWKCGITGALGIAHLADSLGLRCEIYTTTMTYMDIVNPHVSCVVRNCRFFEYFVPEESFQFPMKGRLPIDDYGIIAVPKTPGIGAGLDWELIERNCVSYKVLTL